MPRELAQNTVPQIQAAPASSSLMLSTKANPLMTTIPLKATKRPKYEESTKALILPMLISKGPPLLINKQISVPRVT